MAQHVTQLGNVRIKLKGAEGINTIRSVLVSSGWSCDRGSLEHPLVVIICCDSSKMYVINIIVSSEFTATYLRLTVLQCGNQKFFQ